MHRILLKVTEFTRLLQDIDLGRALDVKSSRTRTSRVAYLSNILSSFKIWIVVNRVLEYHEIHQYRIVILTPRVSCPTPLSPVSSRLARVKHAGNNQERMSGEEEGFADTGASASASR